MKILLPAITSSLKPEGITRHAANLAQCLLRSAHIERVDLVVGPWQREAMQSMLSVCDERLRLVSVPLRNSSWARNRWFWSELPALARELQSDLVHAAYPLPLRSAAFDCPVVLTLHDLYPYDIPENFGFPKVLLNRAALRQSLRAADAIACVSQSTLRRLHLYAPARVVGKTVVIHNCVEPTARGIEATPFPGWRGEKFVLCVAQHRRNKNLVLVLKIFERLLRANDLADGTRLVIVGTQGPETPRIERFLRESGLGDRVVLLAGITEAQLRWFYQHCELLLAPSTIEGFGLPIVEAISHRCRIVCSDIPAFREVGGGYCRYVDLTADPLVAFTKACRAALKDYKFRAAPIGRFEPEQIAEECLVLYRSLLRGGQPGSGGQGLRAPERRQAIEPATRRLTVNVLGVEIDAVNMEGALARIADDLDSGRKGYVCLAGVHGVMEAQRDFSVAEAFAGAALVAPDGMPTVWVGRCQGHAAMERVFGPDLMLEVMRGEEFRDCRHFLCGGKPGVAEELRDTLIRRFPWLRIVGTYTPPFSPFSEQEERDFVETVNAMRPDIVWVGISTPKQERFMRRYLPRLDTKLMFGVGAAFDFHTGRIQDCADWIKRCGLQWLHRLMQDPKHLWKRYMKNNPLFVMAIVGQLAGLRSYPRRQPASSEPGADPSRVPGTSPEPTIFHGTTV
jgi:N-acetylglucosaminyldiphosphoundecaprenol N-acetyl-beta-D-mannosaminyltransferase